MELKEISKNRRSIRKFKDIEISDDIIKEILEAANLTISQPWILAFAKIRNIFILCCHG